MKDTQKALRKETLGFYVNRYKKTSGCPQVTEGLIGEQAGGIPHSPAYCNSQNACPGLNKPPRRKGGK